MEEKISASKSEATVFDFILNTLLAELTSSVTFNSKLSVPSSLLKLKLLTDKADIFNLLKVASLGLIKLVIVAVLNDTGTSTLISDFKSLLIIFIDSVARSFCNAILPTLTDFDLTS